MTGTAGARGSAGQVWSDDTFSAFDEGLFHSNRTVDAVEFEVQTCWEIASCQHSSTASWKLAQQHRD